MIHLVTNQTALTRRKYPVVSVNDVLDYFHDKNEIELDTETDGGSDPYTSELLTVQLGDRNNQFVIDLSTVTLSHIAPLLTSDRLFLLQNAKFDLRFFLHHGINIKHVYDTMLAETILLTGKSLKGKIGLGDLSKKYLNVTMKKEHRGLIKREGLTNRVIEYAGNDVRYLSRIKELQMSQLVEWNLANPEDTQDKYTVLGLENRAVRVFAHMEYKGVKIDVEKWKKNTQDLQKEVQQQRKELDEIVKNEPKLNHWVPKTKQGNLFGWDERHLQINYGSPQQKIKILNDLGLTTDTSEDRFLQKHQDHHEFIPKLRDYNTTNKLASSFGSKILKKLNPVTGRLHTDVWQILKTGRISVSNPNVNQIPRKGEYGPKIRSAFVPEKGCKMVGGDYGAFELRIIAEFSQDPLWLKIFNEGLDLHTELCKQTFDIPEDKVKDPYPVNPDITYRDIQKTINYGYNFCILYR